jgi:hypothetical protein
MNNLARLLTNTGCPVPMSALGAAKRSILAPPVKGLEDISSSLASRIEVSTNLAAESEGYIADSIGDAPIIISFS